VVIVGLGQPEGEKPGGPICRLQARVGAGWGSVPIPRPLLACGRAENRSRASSRRSRDQHDAVLHRDVRACTREINVVRVLQLKPAWPPRSLPPDPCDGSRPEGRRRCGSQDDRRVRPATSAPPAAAAGAAGRDATGAMGRRQDGRGRRWCPGAPRRRAGMVRLARAGLSPAGNLSCSPVRTIIVGWWFGVSVRSAQSSGGWSAACPWCLPGRRPSERPPELPGGPPPVPGRARRSRRRAPGGPGPPDLGHGGPRIHATPGPRPRPTVDPNSATSDPDSGPRRHPTRATADPNPARDGHPTRAPPYPGLGHRVPGLGHGRHPTPGRPRVSGPRISAGPASARSPGRAPRRPADRTAGSALYRPDGPRPADGQPLGNVPGTIWSTQVRACSPDTSRVEPALRWMVHHTPRPPRREHDHAIAHRGHDPETRERPPDIVADGPRRPGGPRDRAGRRPAGPRRTSAGQGRAVSWTGVGTDSWAASPPGSAAGLPAGDQDDRVTETGRPRPGPGSMPIRVRQLVHRAFLFVAGQRGHFGHARKDDQRSSPANLRR